MKIYISADIEGTCGIVNWDETELSKADSSYFKEQMTKEVVAACEGAFEGGATEIFIKDAHDSARNIDLSKLPQGVKLMRGWSGDPLCMVSGLDDTFDGVIFTGYHSPATSGGNPLSHTMTTSAYLVKINGVVASEFLIHALAASNYGVAPIMLTGDSALCKSAEELLPSIRTVAVSEGVGSASISIDPKTAIERIKKTAREAVENCKTAKPIELACEFEIEIYYKNHGKAYRNSFYPGAKLMDAGGISFKTNDYYEALRFFGFVL